MGQSFVLSDELHRYLLQHSSPLDAIRTALIGETAELGAVSGMQVAAEQSVFLTLLTRLLGVRRAVEVGTFTGMSSLSIAAGLGAEGRLTCFDVSEEWTTIARRAWEAAGVADRIDLHIGPAAEGLATLPPDPHLDLAFIDADKPGYITYWDMLVPRIRPGGVILVDNVLWGGRVVDTTDQSDNTEAVRAFNRHARADARVELVIVPLADGLTLARKLA